MKKVEQTVSLNSVIHSESNPEFGAGGLPMAPAVSELPGAGAGGRLFLTEPFLPVCRPGRARSTLFLLCQCLNPGSRSPRSWPQALTQLLLPNGPASAPETAAQSKSWQLRPKKSEIPRPGPPPGDMAL